MNRFARKIFGAVLVLGAVAANARVEAACSCQCVDGANRPVCTSPLDINVQICPTGTCKPTTGVPHPSVSHPSLDPVGASSCQQQQVLNTRTQQYEQQRLCR